MGGGAKEGFAGVGIARPATRTPTRKSDAAGFDLPSAEDTLLRDGAGGANNLEAAGEPGQATQPTQSGGGGGRLEVPAGASPAEAAPPPDAPREEETGTPSDVQLPAASTARRERPTARTAVSPREPAAGGHAPPLRTRAKDVWRFLSETARGGTATPHRCRVSRKAIQQGTGIGSLNTVDAALEVLQGRGYIRVHASPGANEGAEYEILHYYGDPAPVVPAAMDEAAIAKVFVEAGRLLGRGELSLTTEQLDQLSRAALLTSRIVEATRQ